MSKNLETKLLDSAVLVNAAPAALTAAPSSSTPLPVEPAIQISVSPKRIRIDHLTITKTKLIRVWCGRTCPKVLSVRAEYSPPDAALAERFGPAFQRHGYDTRIVRIGTRIAGHRLKLTLRCPRIKIGNDPAPKIVLPPSINPDWKMNEDLLDAIREDFKDRPLTKIIERYGVTSRWLQKLLFSERDKALEKWRESGHTPIFIGIDRVYVAQNGRKKRPLVNIVFSGPLYPLHYIHRVLDDPSDAALTAALTKIFRDLPDPDRLLAVCLDCEPTLSSSVSAALTQASHHAPALAKVRIVIDKFHVLRPFTLVLMQCVNRTRTKLHKELKKKEDERALNPTERAAIQKKARRHPVQAQSPRRSPGNVDDAPDRSRINGANLGPIPRARGRPSKPRRCLLDARASSANLRRKQSARGRTEITRNT